ncbi:MAG: ABC transporter substrate-binding protein [Actinomycetota bacterium]|nr:ABC transporter substrate-binding protein [Actinomycetota bacterium]
MPQLPDRRRTRFLVVSLAALGGAMLVVGALAAWASSNGDSSAARDTPRVGLMHVGLDHVPRSLDGLTLELEEGFEWDLPDPDVERCLEEKRKSCDLEGESVKLMWRNLDRSEAAKQAEVFVGEGVDLIVAFEDQSIEAAQQATVETQTPIIFLHPSDPVRDGLVDSLARPGTNFTGVFGARDLVAKHLEYFTLLIPDAERILALVNPEDSNYEYLLTETQSAARRLGVELVVREASDADDIRRVFRSLEPDEVDAAMLLSATLRLNHTALTLRLGKRAGLPVQAHRKDWVEQGALFSYGSDLYPIGVEAARYVDGILDGSAPTELSIKEISDVEFAVNLTTARRLAIEVPRRMIIRADIVYR